MTMTKTTMNENVTPINKHGDFPAISMLVFGLEIQTKRANRERVKCLSFKLQKFRCYQKGKNAGTEPNFWLFLGWVFPYISLT